MRRSLAGALIRLAHRICRPRVTEQSWNPAQSLTVMADPYKVAAAASMGRRESESWDLILTNGGGEPRVLRMPGAPWNM